MAATLKWIAADVESLLPSWSYGSSVNNKKIEIGDTPPASPLQIPDGKSVLLFTRHMGCPFCEKEIRHLVELAKQPENSSITFVIITHSVSTHQLYEFINNELKVDPLPSNITLFGDAERKVYAAYGLGELSLLNVINRDILKQVMDLKNNEGIANRLTRGTRWQTNGAYAISSDRKITYKHVGKDSSDMADLKAAIKTLSG
ncbi:hypothetical protein P389DRAFT_172668 [Cystobasidium minutum MCA 4210]|uniref:uncharacterized protein n=1 Tax=Cystobasidium minutum MCA 4210 TaxID=1397322 RepID=UPI0034CE2F42|eukprot:jgi/Rhomi1/172668/fgenesh1_kg.5_\